MSPSPGTVAANQKEIAPRATASSGPIPVAQASHSSKLPRHVFLIVLENEGYDVTFGATSNAYLKTLAKDGVLLTHYYGIGHQSLDNYVAMVSGQAPNEETQQDCPLFRNFDVPEKYQDSKGKPVLNSDGQVAGEGCVYPLGVSTIADQVYATHKFTWKAYMEDMGNASRKDTRQEVDERSRCRHPPVLRIPQPDSTFDSVSAYVRSKEDQYATRHNPFVYFHSIIDDDEYCKDHDVALVDATGEGLEKDLHSVETTPNFAFISPNLCHDGHDPTLKDRNFGNRRCRTGKEGGVRAVNEFLFEWVAEIENSPAFKDDGLLIITFDEAEDIGAPHPDSTATADERPGPNALKPGRDGPGGGRVGAVLLSPFVRPGSFNDIGYNHYSMLRSIEDLFGLDHLGFAAQPGLKTFQDGGVFD
jgi:hypothetical protein